MSVSSTAQESLPERPSWLSLDPQSEEPPLLMLLSGEGLLAEPFKELEYGLGGLSHGSFDACE